jgi:uncharacterized protein (DUF362 family)
VWQGLTGCSKQQSAPTPLPALPEPTEGWPDLALGQGGSPAATLDAALAAVGGLGRFVKRGQRVVIKPNVNWVSPPEHASNVNPHLLQRLIERCGEAGAQEVIVANHTQGDPEQVVQTSGAAAALRAAGARWQALNDEALYTWVDLPQGRQLRRTQLARLILETDVLINVPIAKHHSATRLTLSLKNLMGVTWNMGAFHQGGHLEQRIADLSTQVRPDLIIVDGTRILKSWGPSNRGGRGETEDLRKVLIGTDPVAVDACAASWFGLRPDDVAHLRRAHEMGLGEKEWSRLKVREVAV